MRKLIAIAVLAVSAPVQAGLVVTDGSPITLNFNNLNSNFGGAFNATGGSATFPVASDPAGTAITTIYSGSVTPAFTVSTDDFNPGGVYSNTDTYSNANGIRALRDAATTDLAIGVKDSTDRSFVLTLTNNSGGPITSFALSYAIEQYSAAGSASTFGISYSTDGASFVTTNLVGGANVAATTGADVNLATVLSTSRTATINETIADGSDLSIRWFYDHISGTSTHLGIDDIVVTATVPEPGALGLASVALVGLLSRRRRFA